MFCLIWNDAQIQQSRLDCGKGVVRVRLTLGGQVLSGMTAGCQAWRPPTPHEYFCLMGASDEGERDGRRSSGRGEKREPGYWTLENVARSQVLSWGLICVWSLLLHLTKCSLSPVFFFPPPHFWWGVGFQTLNLVSEEEWPSPPLVIEN